MFKVNNKDTRTTPMASREFSGIKTPKVKNRNTRTRCELCSKLTKKTPVRRRLGLLCSYVMCEMYVLQSRTLTKIKNEKWRHSGVFIVNFEYISHLVLVFLLLTLSR